MPRHKGIEKTRTSCRIDPKLHAECIKYKISFSDALERGAIILLKINNERLIEQGALQ